MDDDRTESTESSESSETKQRRGARTSLKTQMRTMPRWHKLVLSLGLLCAALGTAGWVMGKVGQRSVEEAAASSGSGNASAPAGSSSLLTRSGAPDQAAAASAEEPGVVVRVSPTVMRIGLSLVVGFVVGFLFRMFVKTMLLVTLVIGGIFFALTYFNVVNVDFSAAEHTYASARDWLTDQATRLKDVVLAHVPSSASGGVGAFIGFRRR
jgi:uncharacterized membrane protein (Fun14 family)